MLDAKFYLVNTHTNKMAPIPTTYMDGVEYGDGGIAHIYMIEPASGFAGLTVVLPKDGLPFMTVDGHKAPSGHCYMAQIPTQGGFVFIQAL